MRQAARELSGKAALVLAVTEKLLGGSKLAADLENCITLDAFNVRFGFGDLG